MSRLFAVVVAGLLALIASPIASQALAQPIPQGGLTNQQMVDWLQAQNLDATLVEHDDGSFVSSGANGVSWSLIGFDCEAERCQSWQFTAAFRLEDADTSVVNDWNTEVRYIKAYWLSRDDGNLAVLQHDVVITPGMTYEGLTEHMVLYASTVPRFAERIGPIEAPAASQ